MARLRSILFWLHLICGSVCGLVIGLLCVTGVALSYEKQMLAFSDASARHERLGDALPMSVDEQVAKARAVAHGAPSFVTLSARKDEPLLVGVGRERVMVDPVSGETRAPPSQSLRETFESIERLHRWLGAASGTSKDAGKFATDVSTAVFFVLAVTGLVLWLPRRLGGAVVWWFRRGLKGKARDFNWHNVIGFWSLPVIVVLSLSGMVIGYRWASDLVFALAGEKPPTGSPRKSAPIFVTPPSGDAQTASLEQLFATAKQVDSTWETLTWRAPEKPNAEGQVAAPVVEVLTPDTFPRFGVRQLALDPYSAEVLRDEQFRDFSAGRRARSWLRFLHTGEALGIGGQTVAMLASLGGAVMVFTGLSLALRRFAAWRKRT